MATNLDGSVTEVTSQGWGSRIGGSIKGIGTGITLVLVATGLLWWNEGRSVRTGDAINEAQKVTISMPSVEKLDPAFEGKLVHTHGHATTTLAVSDPLFGIAPPPPVLALERKVEFFQWVEHSQSETRKKLGGGTETVTTYNYETEWVRNPVDSTRFKNPQGHDNTLSIAVGANLQDETFHPSQVDIGAYKLPEFLASSINKPQAFVPTLSAEQLEALRTRLVPQDNSLGANVARAALEKSASGAAEYLGDAGRVVLDTLTGDVKPQLLGDGSLYIGRSPSTPRPGDVRVRWEVTPDTDITIIAKVASNTFTSYTASNGTAFSSLAIGNKDMGEMFESERAGNAMMTWMLRALGVAIVIAGFGMILAPLGVLADVIPLLGSIVSAGTGFVSTLLGVAWSFIIIALAWLRFRPLLSIGLLVVAAGLIAGIFFLRRKRAAAAA